MWSPALWDRYDGDLANYGAGVIVQAPDGEEVAPIVERMAAPFEGEAIVETEQENEEELSQVRQSVSQQSNGLRAFAAVVALTAAVLVVQALRRQEASGVLAPRPLLALGVRLFDAHVCALAWATPVALAAAATAVMLAYWLSSMGPVGAARLAGARTGPAGRRDGAPHRRGGDGSSVSSSPRGAAADLALPASSPAAVGGGGRRAVSSCRMGRRRTRGHRRSRAHQPANVCGSPSSPSSPRSCSVRAWTMRPRTPRRSAGRGTTPSATAPRRSASRTASTRSRATMRWTWSGVNVGAAEIEGIDDDVHLNVILAADGWAVEGSSRVGHRRRLRRSCSPPPRPVTPASARRTRSAWLFRAGRRRSTWSAASSSRPSVLLDDQPLDTAPPRARRRAGAAPPELVELFETEFVSNYFLVDLAEASTRPPPSSAAGRLPRGRCSNPSGPSASRPPTACARGPRRSWPPSSVSSASGRSCTWRPSAPASAGSTLAAPSACSAARRGSAAGRWRSGCSWSSRVGVGGGLAAGGGRRSRRAWSTAADGLGTAAPAVVPALGLVAVVVVSVATTAVLGTVAGRLATRHRLTDDFGVTT